jgi:hypothetical protein
VSSIDRLRTSAFQGRLPRPRRARVQRRPTLEHAEANTCRAPWRLVGTPAARRQACALPSEVEHHRRSASHCKHRTSEQGSATRSFTSPSHTTAAASHCSIIAGTPSTRDPRRPLSSLAQLCFQLARQRSPAAALARSGLRAQRTHPRSPLSIFVLLPTETPGHRGRARP